VLFRKTLHADKLHIGCGDSILDGWTNIDLKGGLGVDLKADVRRGLPFDSGTVHYIYAEHFLEHLAQAQGFAFLQECHRVLKPSGAVLRLSTPNLDWVWKTHYHLPAAADEKRRMAHRLNQAFRDWGHQYLYNDVILTDALRMAGFASSRFFPYAESDVEELKNLERHETYADSPNLPHVIIAQAYK